ncbi:flavodoxin [Iamia majanohamensis]|uniref:Flavodoxin n=1 Tax=Iamia majanohamensis TaxID=467976 RepID=A0AAE9Y8A0_9ACTN|nr:flavodoxin [Iamia majanohamensis]WCO68412.1 flavodoxin [Iamia majanohamensis]
MARLLIVHHTPSPNLHTMLEAVRAGAGDPQIGDVEVVVRAALSATAADALAADGYVVGGPANLGMLAGAVKHFFDTIYYPCLEETRGRPFGAYLHGGDDTTGAARDLQKITGGLGWEKVAEVVEVSGPVDGAATDACTDLGGVVAATIGSF